MYIGKLRFDKLPCDGDTINIDGVVFTFSNNSMDLGCINICSNLQLLRERICGAINVYTPYTAKPIYKYIIKITDNQPTGA